MDAPAIENRLFDELSVGQTATDVRIFSGRDIELMSALSGTSTGGEDWNGLILAFLAAECLPGPGSKPLGIEATLIMPIAAGDQITTVLTVREKRAPNMIILDISARNERNEPVFTGKV